MIHIRQTLAYLETSIELKDGSDICSEENFDLEVRARRLNKMVCYWCRARHKSHDNGERLNNLLSVMH